MAFTQPSDVAVGDPTTASNQNAQNDAIADLHARVSGITSFAIANGSFEIDLDSDGEPDGWTITDIAGGSHSLDATTRIGGTNSLKCVTTGGGGYVTADTDFIDGGNIGGSLNAWVQTDTTGVRYRLQFLEYDTGFSLINTITAIDTTLTDVGNWINLAEGRNPVEGPYFKVRIIVGEAGGSVAADVLTDQIQFFSRNAVHTVVDGITNVPASTTTKLLVGYAWLTDNTNNITALWRIMTTDVTPENQNITVKTYIDGNVEDTQTIDHDTGFVAHGADVIAVMTPTITGDDYYTVEYEVTTVASMTVELVSRADSVFIS